MGELIVFPSSAGMVEIEMGEPMEHINGVRQEGWSRDLYRIAMSIRPLGSDVRPSDDFRLVMRQRILGLRSLGKSLAA